jgi:hypothetical protein
LDLYLPQPFSKQEPLFQKYKLSSVPISTAATVHEIPALDEEDMLKNRIQSIGASYSWFRKRKHLGTIAATVMPGIGASGEVADLDQEDVKTIYAWLKRTNEASKVSYD